MPTTNILAVGSSPATSASFDSAIDAPSTLSLVGADTATVVLVELQNSANGWQSYTRLTPNDGVFNLVANGTWRVRRTNGTGGVDRST